MRQHGSLETRGFVGVWQAFIPARPDRPGKFLTRASGILFPRNKIA
jgi:hypothetical protein